MPEVPEKWGPKTCTFYHRSAWWQSPRAVSEQAPGHHTEGKRKTVMAHTWATQAPYKMVFKSNLWSELANAVYTASALVCLLKIPSGGHSLLNLLKETEPVFANQAVLHVPTLAYFY